MKPREVTIHHRKRTKLGSGVSSKSRNGSRGHSMRAIRRIRAKLWKQHIKRMDMKRALLMKKLGWFRS